jgi:hypothetical protein
MEISCASDMSTTCLLPVTGFLAQLLKRTVVAVKQLIRKSFFIFIEFKSSERRLSGLYLYMQHKCQCYMPQTYTTGYSFLQAG